MSTPHIDPKFFSGELLAGLQLVKPLRIHSGAECWLCLQESSGAAAVVKFLRHESRSVCQFVAAAEFLSRRQCPYIIGVLRHGEVLGDVPYAVMEYADGGTLRRRLSRRGALPLCTAVYLFHGLLEALVELEAAGIVHRDIKPENLWLMSDGSFRLGDFGIARIGDVEDCRHRVFGTPGYMSPEQAADTLTVDCRSDIFSVAVVIAEALTGERYRKKGPFLEVVKGILSEVSEPPYERLSAVGTAKLSRLLCRMLSRDVSRRPAHAWDILAELEALELPMSAFEA